MGINGEKILFWTRIVRDLFRINETMRDSDLPPAPFSQSPYTIQINAVPLQR